MNREQFSKRVAEGFYDSKETEQQFQADMEEANDMEFICSFGFRDKLFALAVSMTPESTEHRLWLLATNYQRVAELVREAYLQGAHDA
jgi:hypothetical protein